MPSLYERLRDDGEILLNGPIPLMRFTLTYDGPLLAQKPKGDGRRDLKQEMRCQFHKQLAELWNERRYLRKPLETWRTWPARRHSWGMFSGRGLEMSHRGIIKAAREDIAEAMHTAERESGRKSQSDRGWRLRAESLQHLEKMEAFGVIVPFTRGPFTIFPLATKRWNLVCDLDILFLRAEDPGALFPNTRGDLDNRLKVLFDALTMPVHVDQLPPTAAPDETQDPFFCLLEDDKLITGFRVESERLLDEPPGSNRVKLVIRVTLKTRHVNLVTLELEGD